MARSTGGGSRGGGSFGGGGRSMGGGSRSSSRSFSGSGRSGISSSGGHRSMSGGGFSGGTHQRSNSYNNHTYHSHPHHTHNTYNTYYGGGPRGRYNNGYHAGYNAGGRSGSGCGGLLVFLLMFAILGIVYCAVMSSGGRSEKMNREKFTGKVDSSHGYYQDDSIGAEKFIDSSNEAYLNAGFKTFYNKTGVFPFLYILEYEPDASEYSGYDTYMDMLYEKLFKEEGNLLIVYIADKDDYYYAAGHNTSEIIDGDTLNLISNKVNSYWSSGDLAKAFGDGLSAASKNIMAKSNFRVIMIALIIAATVIIVMMIAFKWWKAGVAQKNKEQEDLERTLSQPLETFGSSMDDLQKKYDNPDQQNNG